MNQSVPNMSKSYRARFRVEGLGNTYETTGNLKVPFLLFAFCTDRKAKWSMEVGIKVQKRQACCRGLL